MATLQGTLVLQQAVISEVVSNPNTVPRTVIAGTSGSVGGGGFRADSTTLDGGFRSYGNGNTRLVLGSGGSQQQTLALRAVNPAELATLRALMGHLVCFRDTYGRRLFGSYISISVTDIPHSGRPDDGTLLSDVGLTFQTVSYNEAV